MNDLLKQLLMQTMQPTPPPEKTEMDVMIEELAKRLLMQLQGGMSPEGQGLPHSQPEEIMPPNSGIPAPHSEPVAGRAMPGREPPPEILALLSRMGGRG